MHAMRKFFSPWKALVAAIAVFASAGSAKADLTLTFSAIPGVSPVSSVTFEHLGNGSTGNFTVGDFTGTYTIHSTLTSAPNGSPGIAVRTLSVDIKATNGSALIGSNAFLNAALTGSNLSGPVNGLGALVAGVTVRDPGTPGSGSGATFSATSFYSGPGGGMASTGNVSGVGEHFSSPTAITISNPYTLFSYNFEAAIAAGGKLDVTGSTQVYGVPEPSGIAAALAGVPCLGLLLSTIRRRLTGSPAPTV